ncbi:MAG: SRPBCC family protein [Hahellaceae bacterium]|jgi:uncharacterized protein YndB with AHSA1/START domain|nr:SRPBCC family protein [Hahellaceae bacterium]MCP5211384.1 SRPBCC family protein [Hahellaceae bacterium]
MAMQYITIKQSFKAPIERVFQELTDHVAFGKILGANITRIKDGSGGFKNGLGSVRQISVFPAPAFEEEVITFEPNKLMEYKVSKGSPIKNHIGRMEFTTSAGMTHLHYTIQFEPKVALPLLGPLLKKAIETPIVKGLKKLANKY